MGELYKQYGQVILIMAVIGCLFTIIFTSWNGGKGYMTTVGEDVGFILEDSIDGDVDTTDANTVLNRDKPKITIKGHLNEKATYYLVDNFVITNADNYVWDYARGCFVNPSDSTQTQLGKVIILSIRDSSGNYYYDSMNHINRAYNESAMVIYDTDTGIYDRNTGKVTFPLADSYTVKIRIMDYENVMTTVECRVSVDYVL